MRDILSLAAERPLVRRPARASADSNGLSAARASLDYFSKSASGKTPFVTSTQTVDAPPMSEGQASEPATGETDMMIHLSTLFALAFVIPSPNDDISDAAAPAAVDAAEANEVDGDLDVLPEETTETVRSECLAIDQTMSRKGTFFGGSGDDHYPMNGKTITRADLQVDTSGHAAANITRQDSTEVTVHWWYDLFSRVTYTLKVWVEC
ncbi:hypothetical protein [Nannocystis punicea]|uniref:Uncharacterized protein n=1 Tax=Nannocystis punicea TaxID=2995304 RepID=A0ABY7HAW7_9BACT|nr:hypothetical protein [Nannocystis poenicansa]WAS96419.1 hypothetical protein O0S08_09695 [Nannocystis poenicansa]